jgi:hypothetical protein
MSKTVITYFFSIAFIFNLMAPSLCLLYSSANGDNNQHLALDFMDTEKEEGEEKGENETKDHKEKEKSENEKLKHQSDTAFLEYSKNTIRAQSSELKNTYKNLTVAVLTPPPRA